MTAVRYLQIPEDIKSYLSGKLAFFWLDISQLIVDISKKFICVISSLIPTLKDLFSPPNPKIPPKC